MKLAEKLQNADMPQTLNLLSDWADEDHHKQITLSMASKL
jgi:hypothetical protein